MKSFENLVLLLVLILVQVLVSYQLDRGKNLAAGKRSYQSSTVLGGVASRAVDGNRHPNFYKDSCIQTTLSQEPWWYVDLEERYFITSIVISNRGDCCSERLTNFEVRVGNSIMESGKHNPSCAPVYEGTVGAGKSIEIVCELPPLGRYVTVFIPKKVGTLNFCEVEVYGRQESAVMRFRLMSYGFGETNNILQPFSKIYVAGGVAFKHKGLIIHVHDIRNGSLISTGEFDTHGQSSSDQSLQNFLKAIPDGSIVAMVLYLSGEKYYKNSLPYLEAMLGQPITADLKWGQSWALLGYKGIASPIPHWRQSVRVPYGKGPSVIISLVTKRKAPRGKPTNIEVVARNGSSIKLTWSRPDDYLTDDDYPFDYYMCITATTTNDQLCYVAVKTLQYTFRGLSTTTKYTISIQAKSQEMLGEKAYLTVTTTDAAVNIIKVKLISRVMEDVFYNVNSKPYSTIYIAGVPYNFDTHGHNLIVLDARTGTTLQTASFNTHEVSVSASNMTSFIQSLPDKVIVLMVVFYRAHVYYYESAPSLAAVCPYAPLWLTEEQSNALICFKGLGRPSWIDGKLSSYSQGAAVIDKDIVLPKDLLTSPLITSINTTSREAHLQWTAPSTDISTGIIKYYELCYEGEFTQGDCIDVYDLVWTIIDLHPGVKYTIKIRAAVLLGYGPYSPSYSATTLEEAPSQPPQSLMIANVFVPSPGITTFSFSWLAPARQYRNGVIRGYDLCLKLAVPDSPCLQVYHSYDKEMSPLFDDLKPFTEYEFVVKAVTDAGAGPAATIKRRTITAVPYGPPTNLSVSHVMSTSTYDRARKLSVNWEPPEQLLRNGIIEKYRLCVRNNTDMSPCKYVILKSNQTSYVAEQLNPYTIYDVIISAATSAGYGPSALAVKKTPQAAPSRGVSSLKVTFYNSTVIQASWTPPSPQYQNGIITKYHFNIYANYKMSWYAYSRQIWLSGDTTGYLATDLHPNINYNITVRPFTIDEGPTAYINQTTRMAVPSGPPALVTVTNTTLTTFQISWSPPLMFRRNGIIIKYNLCIRELQSVTLKDSNSQQLVAKQSCNYTRNVSSSQYTFVFTELRPDINYRVDVRAATKIGFGPPAFREKVAGQCDYPLVDDPLKIPDTHFSASGYLNTEHEPSQARFTAPRIWCAQRTMVYLEIDIGSNMKLLAIATQGDTTYFNSSVTSYQVLYRDEVTIWEMASVGGEQFLKGNANGSREMKHYFDVPITARYVRITIFKFVGDHPCMRVELFACAPAVSPHSISVLSWNSSSITVTWQSSQEAKANGDISGYVICPLKPGATSCRQNTVYTDASTRDHVITNLKPFTNYLVQVSAYNKAGVGPGIEIYQQTAESVPLSGPETIEVVESSQQSIKLVWSEVKQAHRNGIIIKYSLCYKKYESTMTENNCTESQELPRSPRMLQIGDLKPFTEYMIVMNAATSIGWSPINTVHVHRTLYAPPSGPPTSISISRVGATTLRVTWSPPEPEKRNGAIVAYRLCTQATRDHGRCHNVITVNGSTNVCTIPGLQPFTLYTVSVEAGTDGGYGPLDVMQHKTGESAPSGTPTDLAIAFVNKTAIAVAWKSPASEDLNGILTKYMLVVHEKQNNGGLNHVISKTVSSLKSTTVINHLKKDTEYVIEVHAGTKAGFGPHATIHQSTLGGTAKVTHVKKSKKAYVALATAGFATGGLCFLFVIGFFIFVSLLVTGYIPHTRPWQEKRRLLWRNRIVKQQEEEKDSDTDSADSNESESDESEFDSDSESSGSSGSTGSSKDSSDSEKGKATQAKQKKSKKSSKKTKGDKKHSAKTDQRGTTGDNVEPKVDMYGCRPEDILCVRLKATPANIPLATTDNIYGPASSDDIYGTPAEDIYGQTGNIFPNTSGDIYASCSNIYRPLSPGDLYGLQSEDIYGQAGISQDIYGSTSAVTQDIYGLAGASQDIYGSVGASQDIYGQMVAQLHMSNVMMNAFPQPNSEA